MLAIQKARRDEPAVGCKRLTKTYIAAPLLCVLATACAPETSLDESSDAPGAALYRPDDSVGAVQAGAVQRQAANEPEHRPPASHEELQAVMKLLARGQTEPQEPADQPSDVEPQKSHTSSSVAKGTVSNLSALPTAVGVELSWTNPSDATFSGVTIRRRNGRRPANATDGELVYQGNGESFVDVGAIQPKPYVYGIFAHHTSGTGGAWVSPYFRDRLEHLGTTVPVPFVALTRFQSGDDQVISKTISEVETHASGAEQIGYMPSGNFFALSNTDPWYRLYNSTTEDHAVAGAEESGYALEESPLFWGYQTSTVVPQGLSAFKRAHNAATGDSSLYHEGEALPSGYLADDATTYGFARYKNEQPLVPISGGGITAEMDLAAGGVIWHWTWKGKQFINNYACGRQIMATFAWPTHRLDMSECGNNWYRPINPDGTEQPAWKRHGNPLVESTISAADDAYSSRAIPINDNGQPWGDHWGSSDDTLNLWLNWRIGKDLKMNFMGLGPVAQFTARFTAPVVAGGEPTSFLEFPQIVLTSEFNRFWTYDAAQPDSLTEVTSVMPDGCGGDGYAYPVRDHKDFPDNPIAPWSGYGGVIISDATGEYALGIYAETWGIGGPGTFFAMWKFFNCGSPVDEPGELGNDSTKMDVVFMPAKIPAGASSYTSYLINGTVEDVAAKMNQLKRLLHPN